nr:MAG TPA: hypothetical protein [Caudoviricetes sp.]
MAPALAQRRLYHTKQRTSVFCGVTNRERAIGYAGAALSRDNPGIQ